MMRSLKIFALAAVATAALATSHARAADMPQFLPPPPIQDYGGWYLRGDIGMSKQKVKEIFHPQMNTAPVLHWLDEGSFSSAPTFGIGLGYKHNNWFRWDANVEYRGKADFTALDRYGPGGGVWDGINDYSAKKAEWLLMWNAYIDLGTWKGITPFVGAGLGASRNSISNFRDVDITNNAVALATTGSKWQFAWALHAGLAYDVTPNFTVELAYRYLDLGNGQTGVLRDYFGNCTLCQPFEFKRITSHDLKIGLRMGLADLGATHWQPPLHSKF